MANLTTFLNDIARGAQARASKAAAMLRKNKEPRPPYTPSADEQYCLTLLDEANARGWTVVNMKTDWKHVFPFESE